MILSVNNAKTILIYPYCDEYEAYVLALRAGGIFKAVKLISPKGWGYQNSEVYDGKEYIMVEDDFTSALEAVSCVWFVQDAMFKLPDELLQRCLSQAVEKKKKIIFTRYGKSYEKAISKIPRDLNITPEKETNKQEYMTGDQNYFEINVPVISVIGTSENCGKFFVQVVIKNELERMGYKVASISTRGDTEILGMHSFPDFMNDKSFHETEKILSYNYLVKQISVKEKPDVILIGIPGGALPYSYHKHNDFGLRLFEISSAIHSDYTVLCSLFMKSAEGILSYTEKEVKNRFRIPVESYYISNKMDDTTNELSSNEKGSYLTLDKQFVWDRISKLNRRDIYILEKENERARLANQIVSVLGGEE